MVSHEGAELFDDYARWLVQEFRNCTAALQGCAAPVRANTRECTALVLDTCAESPLLEGGLYFFQIKRWFEFFPPEQFKFIHYPDFVGSNAYWVVEGILICLRNIFLFFLFFLFF